MRLRLLLLEERLAITRLPAQAESPPWVEPGSAFVSVTRTAGELSIVCDERRVPADVACVRGWQALAVQGPLELDMVGVLAALTPPLAAAAVPVFVVSTYDTDYILVRAHDVASAIGALEDAGHRVIAGRGENDRAATAARQREAARHREIAVIRAGAERVDELRPLWSELHAHHLAVATSPGLEGRSPEESWMLRRAKYERWLNEPGAFCLIAEREGFAVGYALVTITDAFGTWATRERVGELQTLIVAGDERGRGIGDLLMSAVDRELSSAGVAELTIVVVAGNDRAVRFYERRGYVVVQHRLLGRLGHDRER